MTQLSIPKPDVSQIGAITDDAGFYAANGYFVLKRAFPSELIDELAEWSRQKFFSPTGELLHGRLQDEWKNSELVRRLAIHPPILAKLREFYGREPLPFQTLNFGVGTQQRTHSDTMHFHCFPQRYMCGVWVALEAVDENNGPLHYYPGSHRLPTLECADVGLSGLTAVHHAAEMYGDRHYKLYENAIAELIEVAGLKKQTVHFEKGDALMWAANLLHGGDPIRTQGATRHSQVTHYYFEGCRLYTPLRSDLTMGYIDFRDHLHDIRTGQLIPKWTATDLKLPQQQPQAEAFFTRLGRKVDRILCRLRFGSDQASEDE